MKVSSFTSRSLFINRSHSDNNYDFILRQRLDAISALQEQWPTVLSSHTRYVNQAEIAICLASTVAGAPYPFLQWLMPVVIDDHSVDTDEQWGLIDSTDVDPMEPPLDPEQVTLLDILETGHYDNQDGFESRDEAKTMCRIMLVWELPEVRLIVTTY